MSAQPTWFDLSNQNRRADKVAKYYERYGPAEVARDRGIELVHKHASTPWKQAAANRILEITKSHDTFTSDEVLIPLEREGIITSDTRALAAILIAARKLGLIEATDNFVPTKRPASHRRPIRVWRVIKRAA